MNPSTVATRPCRLLYFGPGGAGKRASLRQIAASLPGECRIPWPGSDPRRQIAFRLPDAANGDWQVTIQAVDTGSEIYLKGTDRKARPFDGIVFVVQSASGRLDQSLSSLEALKSYLDHWGLDITSVPMVIQYNKRDEADCLPVDRLEGLLNPWGLLSFPTIARDGEGVKEPLKAILSLTISQLIKTQTERPGIQLDGSGAGENCPKDEAEKREEGQESVSEPVFSLSNAGPELQVVSEDRGGIFFDDLRPPIVVPVRIPRRLLEKHGSARVVLEIELDDNDSYLA